MAQDKIALLVDSCTDVPQVYIEQYGIYVAPLTITYRHGSYRDRVDITPEEVYASLEQEIPTTSLPSGEDISAVFHRIIADGYTKVLIVAISSGLSGTYNMFKLLAKDYPALSCRFIDTKLIGMGAGVTAIYAAQLIEQGVAFEDLEAKIQETLDRTHLYFCIPTLEYLKKGGRIGRVSAAMGTLLGVLPVIACNEDGVYYTAHKARGWKNVLNSAVRMLAENARRYPRCNLAVVHGGAEAQAKEIASRLKEQLPNVVTVLEGQISPALVVHTGPGLIGMCIQGLADE